MEEAQGRQKHGSGLAQTTHPDWFEIISSVLSDTNQTTGNICSHPKDLPMIIENDRNDDDDKTVSDYEEKLSDLAAAMQSYSSTDVVPETDYSCTKYRDRNNRAGFRYHTENTNCIGNTRGNTKCTY